MMKLPKGRTENIVVQSVGNELLVYDLLTNKAYNLNETSRIIFESCDGKTSFDELSRKHKFPLDFVYFALDEFDRQDLLKGEYQSKFAGVSRREVIRRVGLASMLALPVIVSIIAPKAAQAASGLLPLLATCTQGVQCASHVCGNAVGGGANCCINPETFGCTSNAQCCQAGGGAGSSCVGDKCCINHGGLCSGGFSCCSGDCDSGQCL